MCAKCKHRVESLENYYSQVASHWRAWEIACWKSELSLHYIILTSLLYQVQTLMSHDTEGSETSPESPHLGEIKRMRKQCVPSAPPFCTHAGDEGKFCKNKAVCINRFHCSPLWPPIWFCHSRSTICYLHASLITSFEPSSTCSDFLKHILVTLDTPLL